MNRRHLLKLAVLGSGATLIAPRLAQASETTKQPKHVIFLVSDGMSCGVPGLAEQFSQLARGRGTSWYEMMRTPGVIHSVMDMSALNTPVPDSAAAASCWGSGVKLMTSAVNTLANGQRLKHLGELLRDAGRKVGLVSTARITHATPAGFASAVPFRNQEAQIAQQYLENKVDLLLGGGRFHFESSNRPDQVDLLSHYGEAGYTVVTNRQQFLEMRPQTQILGLFSSDHLPMSIDQRKQPNLQERIPTLAEMTLFALDAVGHNQGGSFLMVEAARVDHAAHANDSAALLWDQLAFDDAVATTLAWASERDDVLVVVSTDHGNAGPVLNGMGTRYDNSADCFHKLLGFQSSVMAARARLRYRASLDAAFAPEQVIEEMAEVSGGIQISPAAAREVAENLMNPEGPHDWSAQHRNSFGVLGQALGNHTGIGWTGTSHTSEPAMFMALGAGAQQFAKPFHATKFFEIITGFAGIEHHNPILSLEESREFSDRPAFYPEGLTAE
ncbi:MAG: alkaline phosphatase [Verrucomicrobiales bacterium]